MFRSEPGGQRCPGKANSESREYGRRSRAAEYGEVGFEDETFWMTQKRMAELFGVDVRTVSHHLIEIFKSQELNELATIRKDWIVQLEGSRQVRREVGRVHPTFLEEFPRPSRQPHAAHICPERRKESCPNACRSGIHSQCLWRRDPTNGFLLIGIKVHGDTLARPIEIADQSTQACSNCSVGYAPVIWYQAPAQYYSVIYEK